MTSAHDARSLDIAIHGMSVTKKRDLPKGTEFRREVIGKIVRTQALVGCATCGIHHWKTLPFKGKPYCSHACNIKGRSVGPRQDYIQKRIIVDADSGCWNWKYTCTHGYGACGRRRLKAHRLSYETYVGPIPDELFVLHSCDNRACVNPDHLRLGTHGENMDDMVSRDRQPKGEAKLNAKLTEKSVREIRRLAASGSSLKGLSRVMSVSEGAIRQAVHRKTWKHVK